MPLVSEHSIFIKQKLFSCFKKSTEQPQIYPFPGGSSKDAGCIHPMETPIRTACILVDGNCCGLCFTSASPAMLSNHKPSAWAAGTGGVCWWTSWRYCKAHSCRKLCVYSYTVSLKMSWELDWLPPPTKTHKKLQPICTVTARIVFGQAQAALSLPWSRNGRAMKCMSSSLAPGWHQPCLTSLFGSGNQIELWWIR